MDSYLSIWTWTAKQAHKISGIVLRTGIAPETVLESLSVLTSWKNCVNCIGWLDSIATLPVTSMQIALASVDGCFKQYRHNERATAAMSIK